MKGALKKESSSINICVKIHTLAESMFRHSVVETLN